MDHAVCYVVYNFLRNLDKIISNNTLYNLQDVKVPNFPSLRELSRAQGEELPFRFAELDDEVMKTLDFENPAPPKLEVINVEDPDAARVGKLTLIPSAVHDMSITVGLPSFRLT